MFVTIPSSDWPCHNQTPVLTVQFVEFETSTSPTSAHPSYAFHYTSPWYSPPNWRFSWSRNTRACKFAWRLKHTDWSWAPSAQTCSQLFRRRGRFSGLFFTCSANFRSHIRFYRQKEINLRDQFALFGP